MFEAYPTFNTTCDLFLVTAQGGFMCYGHGLRSVLFMSFFQNNAIQSSKSFLTAVSKSYIPSL